MKLLQHPPKRPEQRLVWEVLFLGIMIIAIAILGDLSSRDVAFTIILTIIFSVNLAVRFLTVNERGDWMFFAFGVVGGGGNDLMSMINGVYDYTSITILPFLQGLMPLWMILFWGQVFLLFRKVFNLQWFKGEGFEPKNEELLKGWINKAIIFDVALIIILRIVIYNTYLLDPWIPALFYGIGVIIRFCVFRPKKNEIFIMAILPYAFCFEGLMVTFGLYVYHDPSFLGMPAWLFIWWIFLVPIFLKEIFDRMEHLLREKSID